MTSDALAACLAASGRGDTQAFAQIYDALAPRVHGMAVRILGDERRAENVTAQVFQEVWRTASRFDADTSGSVPTWVLTMAHRRAVDHARTSAPGVGRHRAYVATAGVNATDRSAPTDQASIAGRHVRAAWTRLSPVQQQAVDLAYYGGHTHSEISRLLDIPADTVNSRIRDGLFRLRDNPETAVIESA